MSRFRNHCSVFFCFLCLSLFLILCLSTLVVTLTARKIFYRLFLTDSVDFVWNAMIPPEVHTTLSYILNYELFRTALIARKMWFFTEIVNLSDFIESKNKSIENSSKIFSWILKIWTEIFILEWDYVRISVLWCRRENFCHELAQ